MLREVQILEQISKKPHPFIVKYHGCQVHRGRITGIVLERLGHNLLEMAVGEEGQGPDARFKALDKKRFLEAVASAVLYLHSLGLAHNDLNPNNIMVGKDGMPVLIDFDSCQPVGCELIKTGTHGWMEKWFTTSAKENDLYSLKRLGDWFYWLEQGKSAEEWVEEHKLEPKGVSMAMAMACSSKG